MFPPRVAWGCHIFVLRTKCGVGHRGIAAGLGIPPRKREKRKLVIPTRSPSDGEYHHHRVSSPRKGKIFSGGFIRVSQIPAEWNGTHCCHVFFRLPFRQRIEVWIGLCFPPHATRGAAVFLSFGQNAGWGTGVLPHRIGHSASSKRKKEIGHPDRAAPAMGNAINNVFPRPEGNRVTPRIAWGMGTANITELLRPEGAEYFPEGSSVYPKFLPNGMAPIVAMFFPVALQATD